MVASFSSLALTQVLPFLPLAQGDIDYQTERRSNPNLIAEVLGQPGTTVVFVRDGLVAVPDGQAARVDYETAKIRLAGVPGEYVLRALAGESGGELDGSPRPTNESSSKGNYQDDYESVNQIAGKLGLIPMFLGSYGVGSDHPQAVVALDVSGFANGVGADVANGKSDITAETVDEGRESVTGGGARETTEKNTERRPGSASIPNNKPMQNHVLERALERFDWVSLLGFAPHASARETGQATTAVALSNWHANQKYCPCCGSPVRLAMSGWAQQCGNERCKVHHSLLFPRIEPAVITSIVDGQDRLLLQHNKAWANPGLYSVCAGFVEAGENLEHACRREASEEDGLDLGEIKYLGSQPWPFPASLMVAFKARALSIDVDVDRSETVDARFFTRDEFADALTKGQVVQPGKATIARYMIEEWYGQKL
ncbi:NAD(+) diphosphatase [Bifidobacterium sp. ESL0745]|uniref:NAD(+) diphosphatase n=1 Tax=Bifidobacterium sp. ESL0745 TaxID=2983226 RepID=UPI0023F9B0D0|nr:NAD(+) diphosphatase [Bifidobacterium sp. ESL0745]MDF7665570.1 NAD(+) diphosphatase [Bifidobacterium sp. ESL0745]